MAGDELDLGIKFRIRCLTVKYQDLCETFNESRLCSYVFDIDKNGDDWTGLDWTD
jgi:hypothetical protein